MVRTRGVPDSRITPNYLFKNQENISLLTKEFSIKNGMQTEQSILSKKCSFYNKIRKKSKNTEAFSFFQSP